MRHLFSSLLVLLFVATVSAQDPFHFTVQKGETFTVQLATEYDQVIITAQPQEGNSLTLVSVDEQTNTYIFEYAPDPTFEGADGFTLQEFTPAWPPQWNNQTFTVDVVSSMVTTKDDFVTVSSEELITIDPTTNDESTASTLDIKIAQVMHGSAVVNDENEIEYTPADVDRDYVVYSGTDMYGTTSTSTVYFTKAQSEPSEDLMQTITMSDGAHKYIFLPAGEWISDGGELLLGTLEQVTDNVWMYSSNAQVEGDEDVVFENAEGLKHTTRMSIIDRDLDLGFVKNDLVFTARNTQVEFDVKENDEGSIVIDDYSEELYHMGNGVFVYTPDANDYGVETFYYTANNGTEIEEGEVTIVVSNYLPAQANEYELAGIKNQPRVIEYEVPIGTEFFEIEGYPTHGTIEVFGADEVTEVGCEQEVQKVFALYTPNEDYVGADAVSLRYCASDNNICTNVEIDLMINDSDVDACICVDDCVWPGDANGDGVVNIRDVVSIGRYFGAVGEAREASPYGDTYEGSEGSAWSTKQVNGKSIGLADTNGDGFISTDDLQEVTDHYGAVNTLVQTDLLGVKDVPFAILSDTDVEPGEVKTFEIKIGNDAIPAVDMHGLSFALNFPANIVDSASVNVEFLNDSYLTKNSPFIDFVHQPSTGKIHIAMSKSNGVGASGAGIIATVSFIIVEDAEGIRPSRMRSSANENAFTVTASDIVMEDSRGLSYSIPSSSATFEIKPAEESAVSGFAITPNPSSDFVKVIAEAGQVINDIQVLSLSGGDQGVQSLKLIKE